MLNKFNSHSSLSDSLNNINLSFENNPSFLISLLEDNLNFSDIIPSSFISAFYKNFGRPHIYHLESFIRFFFLQNILAIPSDSSLINILLASTELRFFCRFDKVPDPSQFSRFRANYHNNLADLFNTLVSITESICRKIDNKKANCLIYDVSGIELPVKENNPKFFHSKLKSLKKLSKNNPKLNPYSAVYSTLPDCASVNSDVKQQYVNGHFCYALKFGIFTNALGIPRFISFFDADFKALHPEIVTKKSNNPDVDKEIADSVSLKPTLSEFFNIHPDFKFKTFLADAAFDSYDNFALLKQLNFKKVCIPINTRNTKLPLPEFNDSNIPSCPITKIPFIFQGLVHEKGRSDRFKWVCDKAKPFNNGKFTCEHPCTSSCYGRCIYTSIDDNFRLNPGIPRNTQLWNNLYNQRVQIERTINLIKDTFSVNQRKTYRTVSVKANVYLAAITQLIGVILADAIHQRENFKSIRKLITA